MELKRLSSSRPTWLVILFFSFLFAITPFCFIFLFSSPASLSWRSQRAEQQLLRVYIAELPREFSYGLLESYWRSNKADRYPEEPLLKQHSAEFWLLRDLLDEGSKSTYRVRVKDPAQADVVFVPFFAALSAQLQLRGPDRRHFRKKDHHSNSDFDRQRRVVGYLRRTPEWQRSGGRDHVFVLADPMAMWHVRHEISNSIFLVVDFGGWYLEDARFSQVNNKSGPPAKFPVIIQHSQVSLVKDVVVPHTHLLPTLQLAAHRRRKFLLYFRGARYRHRGGLIREKLWKVLEDEPDVVLQNGVPNITGLEEATRGMRNSEFCLNPAGDTPSSCRLYDAIASLCIPVIVSDNIELPFEGLLDYTKFSVFVSARDALRRGWLVSRLRNISQPDRLAMRKELNRVQLHFEYHIPSAEKERGQADAVDLIWQKVMSKVPLVKEATARYRRQGLVTPASSPTARCHCVP